MPLYGAFYLKFMKNYQYQKVNRDTNHKEIVGLFKKMGCSVLDLAAVGGGCPDILVGLNGKTMLVEIKSKNGKLNNKQIEFSKNWKGNLAVCRYNCDVEYVIKLLKTNEK